MTALAAKNSDNTDPVRTHVEMLHGLAEGIDGVLVVSAYNVAGGNGTITHHRPGDVDGMVAAIDAHSGTPGANVYVGLHLMKRSLARGKRGKREDVVAVLGLVADMDADTGNVGALPSEPSYIVETSPGNQQPVWLFDRPLTVAEAAPLAAALKRATGSDHGTADVDHVWRIPGTKNWPNAAKLKRGRSPDPAPVRYLQEWRGDLANVDSFRAALMPWASAPATEVKPVELGDLPGVDGVAVSEKLAAMLAANDVGNRSDYAASVVEQMAFDGHSAETAAALFFSATGNWFARYPTEENARKDFTRLWGKYGARHAEMHQAGAVLASSLAAKVANDNIAPVDLWQRRAHPPLPAGLLPPVIEEFALAQGELMGVDPGGLAAAALAVCAAAIPDSIKLKVKRHDPHWMESARLWVAPIGDPSTKKSPMISAAAAPLKRLDRDLFRAHEEARRKHEALPPAERKDAPAPKHARLRLEDTTIEAAQEVLKDSPDGVLCLQDELSGWFGGMEKYSSGRGAAKDRGFWLQSYNGGPYTVNRIGRGAVLIENLSVSLLGGIQPEPIRALAAEAHDDGLLQRLFPIVLGAAGAGVDKPMPDAAAAYDATVARLTRLRRPTGEGTLTSYVEVPLQFDDAAQDLRSSLAQKYFKMQCAWEAVNKKLASHLGKYDGLFARLCIVFHCIESDGARPASVIKEDTASRAAAFLEKFLFPHAVAFYVDILGLSDRHDMVLAAAGFILAHKLETISVRDVRRGDRIMRGMDVDQAQAVLEQLDAFGWLEPVQTGRRDSVTWRVLPSVHKLFADRAEAEKARREEVRRIISGSLQ
ncbi:hypothetical protein ABIF63_005244 [Bradyrhizobium japonicum]|uniref:RepB-like DNA primase domain-containing protein n=1 Tax=Bradyrhizobium japonicum TaxID=375 RepID=A0ABV2RW23_BRAJP|nr:DUF3987 domain-containing protein [Bradyrhizobium japonicum]UQD95677.1 DUF3987 domain-containing protein [Bradyrhizobium japonicum]WLB22987.1 DUF3987 domain-containing protein [Bradyrhizobium japonicum]